jgi:sugar lactone lactonase YvrE
MEYTSGSWQPVGSPDFAASGSVCSLYVYNGTPYVAYSDANRKAAVMEYTDGVWQPVGNPGLSGGGDEESLFVYNGTPYVAYKDGASLKVVVMEYTGGSWQVVGGTPVSSGVALEVSLFVDNGTPYVAYADVTNNDEAMVMEYTGGSWQLLGSPDFSGGSVGSISLYVDNGTPYVAYCGANSKAAVMEYTSGSWQMVGNPELSSGMASFESLFVYNGTPYVAYRDNANDCKATVMEYTGGSWQYVGSPNFSSGMTSGESLFVYNGTPYLAYEDINDPLNPYNNSPVTVMEYPVIKVNINETPLQMDVPPMIVNGRTLVPLRAIFNALGAMVQWNPADQSITATKGSTTINLQIGSTTALNNGAQVTLDAAPIIINGRTVAPVRFVSESLGAAVSWDSSTNTVTISLPQTGKALPGGIITTVAGNETQGYSGDGGPATSAELDSPIGVAIDNAGNLYIADSNNYRVRKVDTNGIITTIAGNGTLGYSGDGGPATNAELSQSAGLAIDNAGNLYIADAGIDRVRKVDTNGIITTVAGNGTPGYSGDGGPATSAELNWPTYLAIDNAGNLYISDVINNRVRKVDTKGIITTVAGNGTHGYSGDGGPATSAELTSPDGLAIDNAGNLYIADAGNNCIRKVDSNGIITTVAGNGTKSYSGDWGPATSAEVDAPTDLAIDNAGNLYIADAGNNCIRKVDSNGIITTVAGSGTQGYSGDGGLATSAELDAPEAGVLDVYGNLYIADTGNNCIRKVTEVATEIPSNKPDHSPETPSASTDLYSWDPNLVLTLTDLTLKDHYYTVTTSTVPVNEVGSYITSIGYYGTPNHPGGVFRLYTIPKFPNYEEIAVQTKSGYLLAIEGSLVPTPGRQPWIP